MEKTKAIISFAVTELTAKLKLGPELLVCCLAHRGPTGVFFFFCAGVSRLFGAQGSPSLDLSWFLIQQFICSYVFLMIH